MEIPEKLIILGREYRIIKETTHRGSHYAESLHKDCKIILYSSPDYKMPECIESESLLHEIIHSVDAALNLELDENTVARISQSVFAVIRQNDLDFRKQKEGQSANTA